MVGRGKAGQVVLNIIFVLMCISAVAPFLLLISSSLTEEATLIREGYNFFPSKFSLESYEYLWNSFDKISRGYGITVLVTVIGTTLGCLCTLLFAYPLSRKDLPFRKFFLFLVFFSMLFHGGLVPTYMMWTQTFHIKNTIWALIFPSLLMNGFYINMMRSYFQANIPDSLIEAARLDGAGEYTILWKIVLPLSVPMVATMALMLGLGYWNDWTNSLYYITDESLYSIQAILNTIISNVQFLATNSEAAAGMTIPSVGIRMAIAVIGIIPILCIYPFFQKYFVKGVMVGSVKG